MRGLVTGRLQRQGHDLVDQSRLERRDTWRAGFVAQQPIHPFGHEPFLPAPHACLGFAGRCHDRLGAQTLRSQENDPRPPNMFLRRTARRHDRLKPRCVRCSDLDLNTRSHAASSHANDNMGILQMDSFVPINPLAKHGQFYFVTSSPSTSRVSDRSQSQLCKTVCAISRIA